MENRIYYGEYSLKHWIDLIITKNITLPDYQRSFVWDENAVKGFINSLKEKQFVPPVTIAHYKVRNENNETNLILDGQQRLTSILLSCLNIYPNKDKFEDIGNKTASEDDLIADETSDDNRIIQWTFNEILKININNSIEKIKTCISFDERYKTLWKDSFIDDNFWESTFLGFSYIVPDSEDKIEVQKSFSKTFREINYLGKSLSAMESRRSLYFMNDEYCDLFDGKIDNKDVLCGLTIAENMKAVNIDFVRYLSILSQYKALQSEISVLKYYSSYASRESFYADYVSKIVDLKQENHPEKFDGCDIKTIFPNNCWKKRFTELRKHIHKLKSFLEIDKKKNKADFESWIDADFYLFGLIFIVLFENKTINIDKTDLIIDVKSKIQEKRTDYNYSRSPNRLGNLRNRLKESIDIYKKYEDKHSEE